MNRRELLKNAAVLLGGIASASVAQAVLAGVDGRVEIASPIFSQKQKKITALVAEMIIPRTDTPGAIEAGVPHFIELMVSDWYTEHEREIFMQGLASLDQFCLNKTGLGFLDSSAEQQVLALEFSESESENYKPKESASVLSKQEDEDKPFFSKVKELTVLGYYTSQVGATQELSYNPMPMEYGDINFADVGRQWSS